MRPWFFLTFAITIAVNLIAGTMTNLTIGMLRVVNDYTSAVRDFDWVLIRYYNAFSYPVAMAICAWYIWPVYQFFADGCRGEASLQVRRRAVTAPLFIATIGFAAWLLSAFIFPIATILRFGEWSQQLMSQHILSPLVNGFVASATTFLLLDWLYRARVTPFVVPKDRAEEIESHLSLGVRGRLLIFLTAVALAPLFTMLGLARGAADRLLAGAEPSDVVRLLERAGSKTFVLYVILGMILSWVLARSLTTPLADVAQALRRLRRGDLDVALTVHSNDEIGVVEAGVNHTVNTLRENERIMQTFGRVVEPVVRDQLLSGNLQAGGEERYATILFCDLRGFTSFAESADPKTVLQTLDEFFSEMTVTVREEKGFVDKFIGDAMLVVFGLFDQDDSDRGAAGAAAALRSASKMRHRLAGLNESRSQRAKPSLAISGGIHSGLVLAGTIGATDRHEYTVVGDTVNVAARLQEACKKGSEEFLISRQTVDLARSCRFEGELEEGESLQVRGRRKTVEVFRFS